MGIEARLRGGSQRRRERRQQRDQSGQGEPKLPHKAAPFLLQASAGRERGVEEVERNGGGDGLSESRQQGERTKKHIFSQLRWLYFPYRSLLWALCSILAVISQVQVTAITGLMAAVASSLVSLVSPSSSTPLWSASHTKSEESSKINSGHAIARLKSYSYITPPLTGFELWSSSPSAGTHSDPRGQDAVPIPSC